MCDAYKNDEIQEIPEIKIENRDIETLFVDPLGMSTENLEEEIEFDIEEFKKGIKEVSKECGMFTAYMNAGLSNIQAYELILTKLSLEHTKEITKSSNDASIEIAKNQSIMIEKTQL